MLLGVSDSVQQRMPTSGTFPAKLNPVFEDYWLRLVIEVREQRLAPIKAWDVVVKSYTRYCIERQVNPFNSTDAGRNASVMQTLMQARRKIVRYIDEWQMLSRFVLKRGGEKLVLDLSDTGLTIRSTITLRQTNLLEIRQELSDRLFYRFNGPYSVGKVDWKRKLPSYPISIGYSSANNFEGILWYEIVLATRPDVELLSTDLLFNNENRFEKFILQEMWHPLVRTIRFRTLGNRISSF